MKDVALTPSPINTLIMSTFTVAGPPVTDIHSTSPTRFPYIPCLKDELTPGCIIAPLDNPHQRHIVIQRDTTFAKSTPVSNSPFECTNGGWASNYPSSDNPDFWGWDNPDSLLCIIRKLPPDGLCLRILSSSPAELTLEDYAKNPLVITAEDKDNLVILENGSKHLATMLFPYTGQVCLSNGSIFTPTAGQLRIFKTNAEAKKFIKDSDIMETSYANLIRVPPPRPAILQKGDYVMFSSLPHRVISIQDARGWLPARYTLKNLQDNSTYTSAAQDTLTKITKSEALATLQSLMFSRLSDSYVKTLRVAHIEDNNNIAKLSSQLIQAIRLRRVKGVELTDLVLHPEKSDIVKQAIKRFSVGVKALRKYPEVSKVSLKEWEVTIHLKTEIKKFFHQGEDITENLSSPPPKLKGSLIVNMLTGTVSSTIVHTHIFSSGSICWGNMATSRTNAMAQMDICTVYEIFLSILQNVQCDDRASPSALPESTWKDLYNL